MNKLVIHPSDKTTDFLKPIYHGRSDTTVITGGCEKEEVYDAIDKHDHIIMLGHGTPQGLLAMNKFNGKPKPMAYTPVTSKAVLPIKAMSSIEKEFESDYMSSKLGTYSNYFDTMTTSYIIDDDKADLLRNKRLTAIWCNADQYVEWNNLEGFYTGMFISDEGEAKMIGIADTERWQVEESNYAFVDVVRRFIDHSPEALRNALMLEYGKMADRNAVARYNLNRLYTRTADQSDLVDQLKVIARAPEAVAHSEARRNEGRRY
jgi:hypothetical protein